MPAVTTTRHEARPISSLHDKYFKHTRNVAARGTIVHHSMAYAGSIFYSDAEREDRGSVSVQEPGRVRVSGRNTDR